ncbi:UNVERIFIED_CONTAM: hypothetical protein Slati_2995800 [Sesamum latifolium]|uniref:Reverse transcriptase Ty1/copia-type domain-containing protein n=1 Tax=Sesamum latifolium TaxID=2727402 RepID=A0AAW2VGT7_9LAMI
MIRKLVDSKNLEIDDLDHLPTCESYLKGKMTKKPFVAQNAIANSLLDLVHTDVCGPLSTLARGGFSYFITFTDDHSRSVHDEFYGTVPVLRGYALETTAKLLNIATSKMVPQTPYEIWYGKPASYKYLRVWVHRYPKETAGYYFYDPAKQKIFVLRNAVFLENGFPSDNRHDEALIEESSEEPQHDSTASFEPTVHTDGVPVLRRSTRESQVPERYGFVWLTNQLDNNPKTYGEAMSDIDLDKWLEAMKSEMDSMGSNQVWTLVDPPKGVRPVGCKWIYKRKLGADGKVMTFKARLVAKGTTWGQL